MRLDPVTLNTGWASPSTNCCAMAVAPASTPIVAAITTAREEVNDVRMAAYLRAMDLISEFMPGQRVCWHTIFGIEVATEVKWTEHGFRSRATAAARDNAATSRSFVCATWSYCSPFTSKGRLRRL